MKVLIGQFINEANANIPVKDEITTFDTAFGDELIEKMQVGDIFEQAGLKSFHRCTRYRRFRRDQAPHV